MRFSVLLKGLPCGLSVLFTSTCCFAQKVDFARQVEPILFEKCYVCHGPVQQRGGLRLDVQQSRSSVTTYAAGQSELVRRIESQEPGIRMPPWPPGLSLSTSEVETLKAWVAQGAEGNDSIGPDAKTAELFALVDEGNTARLRALLGNRKQINSRDSTGATLLMHAALNAGLDCVNFLIGAGAEINAQNNDGATALIWAITDAPKVRALLAAGADVGVKTNHGGTALYAAALRYDGEDVVRQLLAKGADPNLAVEVWTPIARAACSGNLKVVQLLLAGGAMMNPPPGIASPMTAAIWYGHLDIVRLLLAKGVSPNRSDVLGFTPLSVASLWDRKEIAAALIGAGADVNVQNTEIGFMLRPPGTPLMLASYSESQDAALVKMLIGHGANVNLMTSDGETALGRARMKGESAVSAALIEAGATQLGAGEVRSSSRNKTVPNIRIAVERSLAILQRSDEGFLNRTGCKSCHNQSLPAMAYAMARERGVRFNQDAAKRQSDLVRLVLKTQREKMLQMMDDEGPPVSGAYALAALAAEGYPGDETTTAFVRNIAARQLPDGSWHSAGARPPLENGVVSTTALSVRALQVYGRGRSAAQYRSQIERARRWLSVLQPANTDERVYQLLGLQWAQSDPRFLRSLSKALAGEQRKDGGWGQLAGLPSDAYATGQALYVLHQIGVLTINGEAFERGISFLRETQQEDGSWIVETHAIPAQPYLDVDFPHGKNQFISAAAQVGPPWRSLPLSPIREKRYGLKRAHPKLSSKRTRFLKYRHLSDTDLPRANIRAHRLYPCLTYRSAHEWPSGTL